MRESSFWCVRFCLARFFVLASTKELKFSAPSALFLGDSCFFYLKIYSALEEQIKNPSDRLTLFLLSYLLMLSCFMWVRRQTPLALSLLLSLTALHSGPTVLPS